MDGVDEHPDGRMDTIPDPMRSMLILRGILASLEGDAAPRERLGPHGMSGLRLGHRVVPAEGVLVLPESFPPIPSDLRTWWTMVERAELFRDVDHGQWGLRLHSPLEALEATRLEAGERPDMLPTDLIIARFIGEQDFALMRCDPDAPDWGTIVVRIPMEVRADWPTVARSFTEFLAYWVATNGDLYWDVSGLAEVPAPTDARTPDAELRE